MNRYCVLAIVAVCYITTILVHVLNPQLLSRSKVYLCHICGSLTAGLLSFVIGPLVAEDGSDVPGGCTLFGFLSHFFLLAAFIWTAVDALYLYCKSRILVEHRPPFPLFSKWRPKNKT